MNSKKPRSREQRTKPGTAARQVPVRIVISQSEFEQMKLLERNHIATRDEIFLLGLRSCGSQ